MKLALVVAMVAGMVGCGKSSTINPIFKFCVSVPVPEDERMSQVEWDARQDVINEFRTRCKTLIVQAEVETWAHFVDRVGTKPLPGVCILARKSGQNPGSKGFNFDHDVHDITEMGGTFDGSLQVEK